MNLESQRIIITGGAGMLARSLAGALEARSIHPLTPAKSELDITSRDCVNSFFEQHRPTLVFNCAAFTNVDGCEATPEIANAVNGHGVGFLADACAKLGATLVHFSTDYVFDGSVNRPLRPDDPVGPQSAYGRSKLLGETMIRQSDLDRFLILRTAWLFGPGGKHFVRAIVNAARAGKPLRVVADQRGCPTFTPDLAAMTLGLVESDATGIWHVANKGETNWCDFARAALKTFDIDHPVEPITSADWAKIKPDAAVRPSYSVFDLSPLEKQLGKPTPTWQDALGRYRSDFPGDL